MSPRSVPPIGPYVNPHKAKRQMKAAVAELEALGPLLEQLRKLNRSHKTALARLITLQQQIDAVCADLEERIARANEHGRQAGR